MSAKAETGLVAQRLSAFRCARKADMYLFVPAGRDQATVEAELPDGLMQATGRLTYAMDFTADPARKLARSDVQQVLQNIAEKGYYLQMPQSEADIEAMMTIISAETSGNRPL
ncbi:YcgL domain-containing protein [Allohahella sp. A8]|uniref:YcgL domain-containing protein n=1 Tax=Allohahella sp. A8 TaxID=3141461 RepID=UPI000C0B5628|nr:hypothetical protein [Hahellaceae bacterium]|tara:strand:- start:84774 stop:85112 length:339 start_codon:yes stop_codon:yes gene_type:complete